MNEIRGITTQEICEIFQFKPVKIDIAELSNSILQFSDIYI